MSIGKFGVLRCGKLFFLGIFFGRGGLRSTGGEGRGMFLISIRRKEI
jgi:hypothetical protein